MRNTIRARLVRGQIVAVEVYSCAFLFCYQQRFATRNNAAAKVMAQIQTNIRKSWPRKCHTYSSIQQRGLFVAIVNELNRRFVEGISIYSLARRISFLRLLLRYRLSTTYSCRRRRWDQTLKVLSKGDAFGQEDKWLNSLNGFLCVPFQMHSTTPINSFDLACLQTFFAKSFEALSYQA